MILNRFELFSSFKQLIAVADFSFRNDKFNPFQLLLSPVFTEVTNYIRFNGNTEPMFYNPQKKREKLQILLKNFKESFLYNNRIKNGDRNIPILFYPVENNHLHQFYPIWDVLEQRKIQFAICVNTPGMYETVKQKYKRVFFVHNKRNRNTEKSMQKKIDTFLDGFKNETDLPLQHIAKTMRFLLPSVISTHNYFEGLIEKIKPKAIFVGNDITHYGRTLTHLAKSKKIPTYCIMHGSVTGEPTDTAHTVDCFLLYGNAAKKDLIDKGVPAESLAVSGAPYLDQFLVKPEKKVNTRLKSKLGISNDKPYFFVANSGPGNSTSYAHYAQTLNILFKVATKYRDAHWVIKLHPKDKMSNFSEALRLYPDSNIHIVPHNDPDLPKNIFEWLQGASALLTGNSTVAIEAMLLNIPVITMDFANEYSQVDFIEADTTKHTTTEQELDSSIHDLINKDSDQKWNIIAQNAAAYSSEYFFKGETSSSERVVDIISDSIRLRRVE